MHNICIDFLEIILLYFYHNYFLKAKLTIKYHYLPLGVADSLGTSLAFFADKAPFFDFFRKQSENQMTSFNIIKWRERKKGLPGRGHRAYFGLRGLRSRENWMGFAIWSRLKLSDKIFMFLTFYNHSTKQQEL